MQVRILSLVQMKNKNRIMAKFTITKASDLNYNEDIEVNTIEELLDLIKKYNRPIIIEDNFGKNLITIYDYWLDC